MRKIKVCTQTQNYDVIIDSGIKDVHALLKNHKIRAKRFYVIDSKVYKYHNAAINKLVESNPGGKKLIITSREETKTYETLQKIHERLIKNGYGRDSALIAIGGGIVGDIAGFAASTYMRGIQLVHFPTTLLASVDSAIGGKTGINFHNTKNLIGTFYQPELVIIDTKYFKTLPPEEINCGLGEVIKYVFLTNDSFNKYFTKNYRDAVKLKTDVITKIICESVKIKAAVVRQDEKESGLRKILNFGHTFAHALEVQQNHKLKHGEAVVAGIGCALYLSHQLNLITTGELEKHLVPIKLFTHKFSIEKPNVNEIIKIMMRDKKNRDGEIKFVLLKGIGELLVDVSVESKQIKKSIKNGLSLFIK